MINSLNLNAFNRLNPYNNKINSQTISSNNQTPCLNTLKSDTVSFGRNKPVMNTQSIDEKKQLASGKAKLHAYAGDLLKNELQLQPDQPLKITTDRKFLPLVEIMQEQAYKMDSCRVIIELKDPIIDGLNKKYGQTPDTEWKEIRDKELEENNAASVEFDKENSPYKAAGLTDSETKAVVNENKVNIPEDVAKKLELDPKDVLKGMLGLRKNQPLAIVAEREHEANVYKLAEYALKNGSGPVEVTFTEPKDTITRNYLQYAKEELLTTIPQYQLTKVENSYKACTAKLFLEGEDPNSLEGIDPERISKNSQTRGKAFKPIRDKYDNTYPWTILYAPTTMSAVSAYPKIKDPIKALAAAAEDAPEILRKGQFGEHAKELERRAKVVNDLDLKEIHFVSVNQETKKPDGKTDLYIGLSPKAKFMSAYETTTDGQKFVANVPTEEVFNSPDKTKTHGVVTSTLPLSLNGNLVEGIKMEFKDGKAVKVEAEKNEKIIQDHIKTDEGAAMLGEVALVAGSPIYKVSERKGGIFNTTLLDENAVCHIAVGDSFTSCIPGYNDIKDEKEKETLKAESKINDSAIHTDFMIGGPNVIVEGIKKNGEKVTIIKDDKFQI